MRPIDADKVLEEIENNQELYERERVYLGSLIGNIPTIEPQKIAVANVTFDKEQLEEIVEKAKAEVLASIEITEDEWIPVEERLPEEMQPVLVWFEYYRYGDFNCMFPTYGFCYVCDGKWSRFINGKTGWTNAHIIAWMPLPEPYKEGEET